jgi:hypothetical protein
MAAISADSKELLQMLSTEWLCSTTLLRIAAYCQPATFQHLRCGIKFVFSSKIEIVDGGEGLNSSHGCSTHNMFPFFALFAYTYE